MPKDDMHEFHQQKPRLDCPALFMWKLVDAAPKPHQSRRSVRLHGKLNKRKGTSR